MLEVYRVAFRKKIYPSITALKSDLDEWIAAYNEVRPHQGRWCYGKTPMQTLLDAPGPKLLKSRFPCPAAP